MPFSVQPAVCCKIPESQKHPVLAWLQSTQQSKYLNRSVILQWHFKYIFTNGDYQKGAFQNVLSFRWKRKLCFQDGLCFLILLCGIHIQGCCFPPLMLKSQGGLTQFCPHYLAWWHWFPFYQAMKPLSQDHHSPLPAAADHHSYSTHWSGGKKKGRNTVSTSTVSRLSWMILHTFITIESWNKSPTQRNGTEKAT